VVRSFFLSQFLDFESENIAMRERSLWILLPLTCTIRLRKIVYFFGIQIIILDLQLHSSRGFSFAVANCGRY